MTDLLSNFRGRRLLVLGAGRWQLPYLKRASSAGIRVYATDWAKDAIGGAFAEVFEPIDLADKEATLQFAAQHSVEAVFTAADIGVPTAAFVAQEMGLLYHNEDLARAATDKSYMRRTASDHGLPVPQFQVVSSESAAKLSLERRSYPVIVKPADNCASRGVTVVENGNQMPQALSQAFAATRNGRVLIETFLEGTEGSVEVMVANGTGVVLGICSKEKSPLPFRYDLELEYPGNFSPAQFDQINRLADQLVKAYDIKTGILHIEFIFATSGGLTLIEFAIRGCGSNVVTHLLPAITGCDLIANQILQAFGTTSEIIPTKKEAGILSFIIPESGTLSRIEGFETAKHSLGVVDLVFEKVVGDLLEPISDGRSRPGHLIVVAPTMQQARERLDEARSALKLHISN